MDIPNIDQRVSALRLSQALKDPKVLARLAMTYLPTSPLTKIIETLDSNHIKI